MEGQIPSGILYKYVEGNREDAGMIAEKESEDKNIWSDTIQIIEYIPYMYSYGAPVLYSLSDKTLYYSDSIEDIRKACGVDGQHKRNAPFVYKGIYSLFVNDVCRIITSRERQRDIDNIMIMPWSSFAGISRFITQNISYVN